MVELVRGKLAEIEKKINELSSLNDSLNSGGKVLSFSEFTEIRSRIDNLTNELSNYDQHIIRDALNQNTLKGQVNYLNKILHTSGSTETILVKPMKTNEDFKQ